MRMLFYYVTLNYAHYYFFKMYCYYNNVSNLLIIIFFLDIDVFSEQFVQKV